MEPVQLANPENAFDGGVLDKKWMFNVVGHLNLWHAGEVKLPSTDWGSGKILVSNAGWVVDLTKLKVPDVYRKNFREFHIEAAGSKKLRVSNGTLFGSLPTGFSANDNPPFEITARADASPLQSGDRIYAKVTWNRTVGAFGTFGSTITTRTIEAGATVPTNDPLTATRHYGLATITLPASNIPIVSQTRWGPIGDLPGTASENYVLRFGATGTADAAYYDLLYTNKGHKSDGSDIAPSYDSIQTYQSGLCRVYNDAGTMKIFIAPITVNSIGQITWIGPEAQAWP